MPAKKQEKSMTEHPRPMAEKIVPDTSVIIEGLVSKKIEEGELKPKIIIFHEATPGRIRDQDGQVWRRGQPYP